MMEVDGGAPAPGAGGKMSGSVKWFNSTKGFGFITPEDGGEDIFVHQSEIHAEGFRSLAEGENVEFSIITGDDGRQKAAQVTGPGGGYVKGAPRQPQQGFGGGGGGGRGGGGYGGGGYGGGRGGYGGGGGYGDGGYGGGGYGYGGGGRGGYGAGGGGQYGGGGYGQAGGGYGGGGY